MKKEYRQGRLGEEIRKVISDLLLREIKDPRLSGIVSISGVEVTSDRSYATVYVSTLDGGGNNEEKNEDVLTAFRSAKGLIRREIGNQIKIKHVPELIFKIDDSMVYGRRISEIIDSLGVKKNNTINDIANQLMKAGSILIFPHILMDGDTLGSSIALCRALKSMGKESHILIEDKIPGYLQFLDDGSCTFDVEVIREPDVCICIDCADIERFALRKQKFLQGKATLCIDHHKTSECFADYNYIDSSAAAAAEIIYELLNEMGAEIDKISGEALYAAIITDTGNFQYTNTRVESHLITVDLFDLGIDRSYVSMMLYQNTRIEKMHVSGLILNTIKMMANGEAVMAYVTGDMLKEVSALMEDTEGASEMLRNISGVELSIFVKETGPTETKFSMRSKKWVDTTELTVKYRGGGHTRAAGCTMEKPIFEAMKIMEGDVEEYFVKHSKER